MIVLILLFSLFCSPAQAAWHAVQEPTIQEVQEQAVKFLGFDQRGIDGWQKRARWAAAMPRLQVGVQRELRDVVSLNTKDNVSITGGDVFIGPNENAFNQYLNQGTSFEVKAVWSLNELVFSRDSLAVSAERRDWLRERGRVLQVVTEAYFARKRLQSEIKIKTDPLPVREKKKLLLDQANGMLDALTGGWFSQQTK